MTRWLAAIDQGTTSSRCIVFDASGAVVSSAQKEHEQIFPQAGWVEHNPIEIWTNTKAVIDRAIRDSKLPLSTCAGIGITNQRETVVLWNAQGEPVHNALVWQDTRVNDAVARLIADGQQAVIRSKTGLPLASYFSALKLKWLLDHIRGSRAMAQRGELFAGTIDSWLLWNLTGGSQGGSHLTDVTNASRTQLMDIKTLQWDEELLKIFDIPGSILPRIVASSGYMATAACTELKGAPIAGVLGDQQSALVGQACFEAGEAKNTYGTGCFMLLNTGTRAIASKAGLLTTVAYQFGNDAPCYALEGSIAIAGALVQWLRDNLGLIAQSSDIESLANSVADNGDVYIVPAFSGLYAPHWREDARGIFAGLTRFSNRGHIARAALESVAFQTCDVLSAMEQDSGIAMKALRVDGGMVVNDLLMQFQADMLGVPVIRPEVTETTALGAAYAAGLAMSVWKDTTTLRSQWREARRWTPKSSPADRERLHASWSKAVQRSYGWVASTSSEGGS